MTVAHIALPAGSLPGLTRYPNGREGGLMKLVAEVEPLTDALNGFGAAEAQPATGISVCSARCSSARTG